MFAKIKTKIVNSKFLNYLKSNILFTIALTAVLGFIILSCMMFYEHIFFDESSFQLLFIRRNEFFNNYPEYLLWISLLLFQPIVWIVLIFPATKIILELSEELNVRKKIFKDFVILLFPISLFLITIWHVFYPYLTLPISYLEHHEIKITVFIYIGQVIGIYYLFGITLDWKVCCKYVSEEKFSVAEYKKLKSNINTLMNFAAILFTLGTLSLILLNNALQAYPIINNKPMSGELIISFGLMNTVIILIIYLPAHFEIQRYGKKIIERVYSLENLENDKLNETLKKQKELSDTLNNSLSAFGTLKNAFVILSPFISALLPKFLDLFK